MTGMIIPSPALAVWALKALQKSMMLTPCWPSAGPTGGAGVAFPAGMCSFTNPTTFFAMPWPRLELLDLEEVELDRRRPPEDGDHHLHRGAVVVDLVDIALEIAERPIDDPHRVAALELEFRLRLLGGDRDLAADPVDLLLREGRRLDPRPDEPGHLGGVLHHVPGGVGHLHVDQDVTGEELLLRDHLGAVPHLDHVLGRDQDLADAFDHPEGLGSLLEALAHLVLVPGVRVHDVPLLRHG